MPTELGKINPKTSTSCAKMTGTGVHHVEQSKKCRDPSFEHLRIYDRNLPIKTHSEHISSCVLQACIWFYKIMVMSIMRPKKITPPPPKKKKKKKNLKKKKKPQKKKVKNLNYFFHANIYKIDCQTLF